MKFDGSKISGVLKCRESCSLANTIRISLSLEKKSGHLDKVHLTGVKPKVLEFYSMDVYLILKC